MRIDSCVRNSRIRWLARLLVIGLAWVSGTVFAHMEGTCLLRLADAAEMDQRCQIAMTAPVQCQPTQQALDAARLECQNQLFVPPDIEHAITHGRDRVGGSAEGSPYKQSLIKAARQQSLLEPNEAHFQAYFGLDKQHYGEMTDDYFDEPSCPNAFRGANGRYRMVGTRKFQRLSTDRDKKPVIPVVEWLFFEAHAPDACIAAPKGNDRSPWGELAIVNIPRELLLELAADRKHRKVYLCVSLQDCELQLQKLDHAYNQYAEHIGVLHRLEDCSIGAALANGLHFTKAGQKPLRAQDAFCQQEELDTLELNERKFIDELDAGIFEHGRLP